MNGSGSINEIVVCAAPQGEGAFRAAATAKMVVRNLLPRTMIGANDCDLCLQVHIFNLRIVVAIAVDHPSFGYELFCGTSLGVATSDYSTFITTPSSEVAIWRLHEGPMIGTDDRYFLLGA